MLNYMYEYFTLLFATANKNHKKKKKSKFIWNINTRLSLNSMSSFHSMDVSIKDVR